MSEPSNSKLPDFIGPYRIIRRVGQGGTAQIFLGVFYGASGFEKKVAIKTLLPEFIGDGTLEKLLIEEAKLSAQFGHRNLVQCHELGIDEGMYYLRLEYIDGVNLATFLRTCSKLSVETALFILEELCLALDYVHTLTDEKERPLGLVHRDISPSNILLSRSGEVKLADFGIAKATRLSDITWGKILKGKYAYMSPEQVKGNPLKATSDQFSLGITFFELLTGNRPFDQNTPLETMDAIQKADLPPLSEIPEVLHSLLKKCLAKVPEERFDSMISLWKEVAVLRREFPLSGSLFVKNLLHSS